MVAGISRRGGRNASFTGRNGRRLSAVCAALGALAALSAGLAPGASAADVQSQQWYLSAMKADEMWKLSTGKGVKVAVVDTGVNPDTPSMKGQVLPGDVSKTVSYKATEDYLGHGTTMAEIIAGTGVGDGLKGLAPGAKIVPYRIATKRLKSAEETKKAPALPDVIRAIADSDAKIISMSFTEDIERPEDLAAIKYAQSKGKLMFAGTGNDAAEESFIGYPAAYPYVVGVAAADESGKVGKFSEHGNYVDLAAPGLDVPTWCDATFRSYCDNSGTSLATAIASASAALIWSAHPDWTANQVLASLIETAGRDWAKDDPSTYLGYGLIRPRKVLEDSNFNPGAAGTDPLARENARGVTGVGTDNSPSPSASTSSQPPKNASGGQTSAAGSSSDSSDDNTTMWVALGAAAAVLVIGGGAFAVVRSRRGA
ncbi:serine protease [Streptomyces galilaeus]|uniref:S8 family serine peptidase n=2 Tax=Streptomyces galilaeus TaxID=33899 RepID=UPI00123C7F41|nr:S8 family serine peptidase [Streptomyces galilaeus]QEU68454.1 serine protease [Streptomyces galilaeus]GGW72677.1 type VII secretion-associated serine protease [Streptomyces galilaeus]